MAGSGYKTFVAGQALTAAQVQGYLQDQAVQVFASTAARSSALGTAVSEGMVSYRTDENALEWYTGSAWETVRDKYVAGKNIVLNSAFDFWQRGTSVVASTGNLAYSADRWCGYRAVAGMTTSRQTTSLTGIQYCARVQRDSGNTSTSNLGFCSPLETSVSLPLAGQTVTLSFYARAGANYSSASNALNVSLRYGTGTDQNPIIGYTGLGYVVQQTATLTTSWQRFTYTGTVPSTATELAVFFDNTPVGTAGAADYYEITGVQLEAGSVATPFSRNASSIQGELAACQRYYWRTSGSSANQRIGVGAGISNTVSYGMWRLPVTMRVTPTSVENSGLTLYDGVNAGITVTSVTLDTSIPDNAIAILNASGGGITAYRPYQVYAGATGYIGFSAEL